MAAVTPGLVMRTGKQAFKEMRRDDLAGLSAELAYRFFFALFPSFIFLAALAGFLTSALGIENPTGRIMDTLGDTLPSDASSLLRDQLESVLNSRNPALLSFGIVGAIWAASGGVQAVMKAMNRAYGVCESRPFWKKYLIALGIVVGAGLTIIAAFTLMVAGEFLAGRIADALGMGDVFAATITWARWLAVLVMVMAAVGFLYWAAPNFHARFRFVTPGAVLFTVVWILATVLFGLYVANFGSYSATYGALGGVIILLTWLYLTSFILLLGAEMNAIVDAEEDPAGFAERQRQVNEPAAENGVKPYEPMDHMAPRQERPRQATAGRIGALVGAVVAGGLAMWQLSKQRH